MSRLFMAGRRTLRTALLSGLAAAALSACSSEKATDAPSEPRIAGPNPFANSNVAVPPGYKGPLFQLSHAYPAQPLPPLANPPWRAAIGNGPITPSNAAAYVAALKDYVAPAMRKMLLDNKRWNAPAEGWYNEPWLGDIREPTHGMYVGNDEAPVSQYPRTGLSKPFTTYVLTYYDKRAANSLFNVWGTSAMDPAITKSSGQFADGAVVVKAAFATANADVWPAMGNALQWQLYITENATTGGTKEPQLEQTSFFQFDIIVKDTLSAPKTGWVFSTLVYDKDAPGNDVWDKMVPLGAQWGNDPEVNSALPNPPPLQENWINPSAPAYAKTTLGWGGRLSGPNDGALNDAIIRSDNPVLQGKQFPNLPSSSCMGCHISSQWPMRSFLLPSPTNPPQFPLGKNSDFMVLWAPGSPGWMRWFQDPPGTQAMDPGGVAFDFDMVFVFKSLPQWLKAVLPGGPNVAMTNKGRPERAADALNAKGEPLVLNEGYNGKPLRRH